MRSSAIAALSLLVILAPAQWAAAVESQWVRTGATGRLIYVPDAQGDRILDFSNVGYKGRGSALLPSDVPTVRTVSPIAGDDTANIQAAINAVAALPLQSNGYRGAVLLTAGDYDIGTSLSINSSGVVLRGVGRETTGTVLHGRGTTQRSLIQITGTGSQAVTGSIFSMVDKVVPAGSTSFRLNSTVGLAVGQTVRVERPGTQAWVDAIGMNTPPGGDPAWAPNEFNLRSDRIITRIEGDRVFVDAPLATSFEAQFGGGTLQRYNWAGRIQNVGVENMRAESDFNAAEVSGSDFIDEDHAWTFVTTDKSQNVWVRNSLAKYFGYAAAQAQDESKWFTVDNVINQEPVSIVTGERRYSFDLDGQMGFVTNAQSDKGRHNFVNNGAAATTGPNVFHNSIATNSRDDIGPHRRWTTGTLFDNIVSQGNRINARNRGDFGTSHGWSGANMVIWNSTASGYYVQNPPTSQNWLVGSIGPIQNDLTFGPQPPGNYDSPGVKVTTGGEQSLYDAQFNDTADIRVFHAGSGSGMWNDPANWDQEIAPGVYAVSARDYLVGDIDGFAYDGSASVDRPYLQPEWQAAIEAQSTQPIKGLDDVAGRHNVAFTMQHQLDAGERVVHGFLALALRRANRGETNGDFLQLFDMDPAHRLSFAALGWSASVQPDETFVGVVDMGGFLDHMQSGSVNVQINDDTGLDWAIYVATVATPIVGAGGANVFIDGGGSVTVDSAIAPIETLQVGGGAGGELILRSAAALSIVGDYLQNSDGTLRVELNDALLAGPAITIADQAQLAGELKIELAAAYVPELNDTFELLQAAGGVNGSFDDFSLPPLPSQLGWTIGLIDDTVVLQVVANGIAGDFNNDGRVDAADYTVWRDSYGQSGESLAADGSGSTPGIPDGVVDQLDYEYWKANFGNTPGSEDAAAIGVPEPTSLMMTGGAILLSAFGRSLRSCCTYCR
jgi:hypothetical protein